MDVDRNDRHIYLWDVTKFCIDSSTAVDSFELVTEGVEVLEQGVPQGEYNALLTARLQVTFGAVAEPYATARFLTEDGQQTDKTFWFKEVVN
jgi:hypothetical protein